MTRLQGEGSFPATTVVFVKEEKILEHGGFQYNGMVNSLISNYSSQQKGVKVFCICGFLVVSVKHISWVHGKD